MDSGTDKIKVDAFYLDSCILIKWIRVEDGSRLANLLSALPKYTSMISVGECLAKWSQNYLSNCRLIIEEINAGKIKLIEPASDRRKFAMLCNGCVNDQDCKKLKKDVWHLMAFLELQKKFPNAVLITADKNFAKVLNKKDMNCLLTNKDMEHKLQKMIPAYYCNKGDLWFNKKERALSLR